MRLAKTLEFFVENNDPAFGRIQFSQAWQFMTPHVSLAIYHLAIHWFLINGFGNILLSLDAIVVFN